MTHVEHILRMATALGHPNVQVVIAEGEDELTKRRLWDASVVSRPNGIIHIEHGRTIDEALVSVASTLGRWIEQRRNEALAKVRHFEAALEPSSTESKP